MKKTVVSILAALICAALLLLVAAFGYGRYKAGKARDAAFSSALQNPAETELDARLPVQLGNPHARSMTRQDRETLDRMSPAHEQDAPAP